MVKISKTIMVMGKAVKWLCYELAVIPTALFQMRRRGWTMLELLILSYSFLPDLELCRGLSHTTEKRERSDLLKS